MSTKVRARQYADPLGSIVEDFLGHVVLAAGTTVPTDGTAGYAPGCIFFDEDSSTAGNMLYINEGSATSCDFNPLPYLVGAEVVSATNVITAAENGKTFFLSSATEFVSTLPAPALGLRFTFIVAAAPSGADYTVVTNASANIIVGHVLTSQDAGGNADSETSGGDTVSFVDSKAVVGDRADFISDGTSWFVRASCKTFDAITITTAS